jgi:cysteine synthase
MRALSRRLGRRVGGSTGTNLVAIATLVDEMAQRRETGSIVTILCDGGERYGCTYYDDDWLAARGIDWRPYEETAIGLFGT